MLWDVLMLKAVVRVICAIGQSGQMGLEGRLPWEGNRSPEYKADVARFFDITRGQVLAAGPKTISSVPEFARVDRQLVVLRSNMDPEETLNLFAGRIVFIGGGPPVWDCSLENLALGWSARSNGMLRFQILNPRFSSQVEPACVIVAVADLWKHSLRREHLSKQANVWPQGGH